MSQKSPDISVVILCYRSENLVPIFIAQMEEALERRGLDYELVLVGNYLASMEKTDHTPEIIRKLAKQDPHIKVVVKEKRGMMGWDMRTGLEAATADVVSVIDGDGQMPAADIVRVYDRLKSGNYDIAKTYRIVRYDGSLRFFISKI